MLEKNMYSEFQDILLTVQDRNELLDEISLLSAVQFSTEKNRLQATLENDIRLVSKGIWKSFFEDSTHSQIEWQSWKDELQKLPVIQIQVGVELSKKFITQIAHFIRQNPERANALIDIQYMPKLIGGTQIIIEGKFYDYSLSSRLKTYFSDHSQEIMALLIK